MSEQFWTINLIITEPSDLSSCTPEGFLNIDLSFNLTCRVIVYPNQGGNPSSSGEYHFREITVPTKLHFPGNMNRADYYSALHQWLRRFPLNSPSERDVVNDFTDFIIDNVFARVNLHEKLVLRVAVDLHLVSEKYATETEMEMEEKDEQGESEIDQIMEMEMEDEQGLDGYQVEQLSHFYSVVAAEEHRRFGECSICLDDLFSIDHHKEEEGRQTYLFGSPCGHFFHNKCMTEWLRRRNSCPLCQFRSFISSLIQEYSR